MDTDQPAIVAGSTHTVRTLVDGTLTLTLHVEPRHAQAAFAMFGAPGTPVAVAKLVPEAAQQAVQREASQQEADHEPARTDRGWGYAYVDLYRLGWFNNPRVAKAFGASMETTPDDRIAHIKGTIYDAFDIESMAELEPQYFVADCDALGIRDTLPASVIEAARGRAI